MAVSVGTNIEYAEPHITGILPDGRKIPKRDFLEVDKRAKEIIENVLGNNYITTSAEELL